DTFTTTVELAGAPVAVYPVAVSAWLPFASVLVSRTPAGSPRYWYGDDVSVHPTAPSIEKSTRVGTAPLAETVHVTAPDTVCPLDGPVVVSTSLGFRTVTTIDEAPARRPAA